MLSEGKHIINGTGELETGGVIRGIFNNKDTILHSKEFNSASTLLDFSVLTEVLYQLQTLDFFTRFV